MKLSPEQLRALQLKQLECMVQIDKICRENGLTYYLIGGTLLGAIRHKGFIPWDDDLDIGMPRKDYERFLEIGQSLLGDKYFFQNYKTERNFNLPYSKVRINRTIFRETAVAHVDINHGIFVDVFPLDFVSNSYFLKKLDAKMIFQLQRIILSKFGIESGACIFRVMRKICGLFMSVRFSNKLIEIILKRPKSGNFMTNPFSPYGYEKEMLKVAQYGEPIERSFEGCLFFTPRESEFLLRQVYSDYMQLPPENQRGGWHAISDFNI